MSRKDLYFDEEGRDTGLLDAARDIKREIYKSRPDISGAVNAEDLAKATAAQYLPPELPYLSEEFSARDLQDLPLKAASMAEFEDKLGALIETAGGTEPLIDAHLELYQETGDETIYQRAYMINELAAEAAIQQRKSLEEVALQENGITDLIKGTSPFSLELIEKSAEISKDLLMERLQRRNRR